MKGGGRGRKGGGGEEGEGGGGEGGIGMVWYRGFPDCLTNGMVSCVAEQCLLHLMNGFSLYKARRTS